MRGRRSLKPGPCLACGTRDGGPGGFEDAHIVAAGVRGDGKNTGNGCDCPENKLRLCWKCHRLIVHGIKGGWAALLAVAEKAGLGAFLTGAVKRSQDHYQARCRGETACSENTKAGQAARARIAAAEAREGGNPA